MSRLDLSTVPPFRDGLYLGVNAVPDVALVVDCPQGCYFQVERVALNHDLTSTLLDPLGAHRLVQTEVDYARLPMGTEAALERTVEAVVARLAPALVLVTEATMVELTGNDLDAVAARLEGRLGLPVRRLRSGSLDGDYLDGFAAFLEVLADVLAPARVEVPEAVGVVGYFADRLEHDHRASLAELRRLVEGLGVPYAGALCDGGDTAAMRRVLGAGTLVGLPHARGLATRIAARTGARALELPLPLGLAGTSRWVQTLADALGKADAAASVIDAELRELVPLLDHVRTLYLQGRTAVLVHDPHWAQGLVPLLHELALHVPLVALRRHRGPAFSVGEPGGGGPRVLDGASVQELRDALDAVDPARRLDVLLGAAEERVVAHERGASFIELGYPALTTHCLAPRPLLGFAGARRLADDVLNAVLTKAWSATAGRSRGTTSDEPTT